MYFRLKTSKYVQEALNELKIALNLTPNIIARLAVALSLTINEPVPLKKVNDDGLEFNRVTLTGRFDHIFKAMIAQHCNREISDEEYFPELFNAHLERGIRLLQSEYKQAGNYEKLIRNLILM